MGNDVRFSLSSLIVSPGHPLKVIVSFQRNHFSVGVKFYVRCLFDTPDKVTRHRFSESVRSNQNIDPSGGLRQKDSRLTSRVAAANDNYFFASTQLRLQMCGPVVDTSALKLRKVFELQSAVLGTRGNYHRARKNAVSVSNQHRIRSAITSQSFRVLSNQHLYAEL